MKKLFISDHFRKTLTVILFFILTSFTIPATVYVCLSPGAKKYHYNKTCRGLNNCTHEIKMVTKEEAESQGLDLCGWED